MIQIGLKACAESYRNFPGFGMKVALTNLQVLRIYSKAKFAPKTTHSFCILISGPFWALLDKCHMTSTIFIRFFGHCACFIQYVLESFFVFFLFEFNFYFVNNFNFAVGFRKVVLLIYEVDQNIRTECYHIATTLFTEDTKENYFILLLRQVWYLKWNKTVLFLNLLIKLSFLSVFSRKI